MSVLIWHSSMFVCLEMRVFITFDKGTRHVVSHVLMFVCLSVNRIMHNALNQINEYLEDCGLLTEKEWIIFAG